MKYIYKRSKADKKLGLNGTSYIDLFKQGLKDGYDGIYIGGSMSDFANHSFKTKLVVHEHGNGEVYQEDSNGNALGAEIPYRHTNIIYMPTNTQTLANYTWRLVMIYIKQFTIILFMLLSATMFTNVHIVKAENKAIINSEKTAVITAPKKVKVVRQSDTSLKLKWKKVKDVDGYVIYRYSKKQKKYIRMKKIKDAETTKWIDKGLKTNKTYRYKICSYKNIDGKKVYSKKSYWVKAKTYKRNAKIINAGKVSLESHITLGLTMSEKMEPYVMESKFGTNKKKKAL